MAYAIDSTNKPKTMTLTDTAALLAEAKKKAMGTGALIGATVGAAPVYTAPVYTAPVVKAAPVVAKSPAPTTVAPAVQAAPAIAQAAPAPAPASPVVAAPAPAAPAERNIAAEINAATPGTAEYNRLLSERYAKVTGNPELMAKYGNDAYSQAYLATQQQQQPDIAGQLAQQNQQLIAQYQQVEAQQAQARAALAQQVQKISSPENYQAMLAQALNTMMPQFEAQKQEIQDAYAENARMIDVDQERRGVFSSGFGAEQQRKNTVDQTRAISAALAEIQAKAAEEARATTTQQLQALGLQGDWLTSDASRALQGLGTMSDINQSTAGTALTQRGQDMEMTLEQARLLQNQNQFDTTMRFNETELQQKAQQFADELALSQRAQDFNEKQFAASLQLDWAQLGASQAAQAADAAYRAASLRMAQQEFASEQEAANYERSMNRMAIATEGYSALDQILSVGRESGESDNDVKEDMLTYAAGFKYDPDLYADLLQAIDNSFRPSALSGLFSDVTSRIGAAIPEQIREPITESKYTRPPVPLTLQY